MKKYPVEKDLSNVVLKSHIVFLKWFDIVFFILLIFPIIQAVFLLDIQRFFGHIFAIVGFILMISAERLSGELPILLIRVVTYFQLFLYGYPGLIMELNRYDFFDIIINVTGGFWLGILFFSYIFGVEIKWSSVKHKSLKWKVNIYTVSLVNMIKVFWEVSAFAIGIFMYGLDEYIVMYEGTLNNTMMDLIYFNAGQTIGIIFFWIFLMKKPEMKSLLEYNGRRFVGFLNNEN